MLRPFLGLQVEPGSIVSSNLLTLLVLPTLYAWSERDEDAEAKERLSTAEDDPPVLTACPPVAALTTRITPRRVRTTPETSSARSPRRDPMRCPNDKPTNVTARA